MSVEFGLSLHRLAVAGLLATVTLATVGWDYADAARATRHEAKAARPDTRAPRHHARVDDDRLLRRRISRSETDGKRE